VLIPFHANALQSNDAAVRCGLRRAKPSIRFDGANASHDVGANALADIFLLDVVGRLVSSKDSTHEAERRFRQPGCRSTDPNSHVAVAAGIPLPTAIVAVIVAVGVGGAAGEGKAAKTAVDACAVKLAATMEGERTRRTVPTHREPAAAESTAAEAAAHGVGAHPAMRADSTVSAAAVSTAVSTTTTVSATTVSAATTRRRNGWSKGDRRADCGGGGKDHDALSEHDSVPP
jgi:hypothetical protein